MGVSAASSRGRTVPGTNRGSFRVVERPPAALSLPLVQTEWLAYDDLPEEAKQTIRHGTDDATPEDQEEYARQFEWQMEQVSVEEIKARIMASGDHVSDFGGSWDAYHAWYLSGEGVPDHGSSRWPVMESIKGIHASGAEYLDDGWHRLHSYVRAGDSHIPVLRPRLRPGVDLGLG